MNVEREPFESEVAFESRRLREEGQHRVLTKAEVYARGVCLGDRVFLRQPPRVKARECPWGTIVFDDHGVEARVAWDGGGETIELHRNLRWLQLHQDVSRFGAP